VEIYLTNVAAARAGADLLGVCSLWASPVTGAKHAQHPLPAAGTAEARLVAFPSVPAMTWPTGNTVDEPLTVNGNRKQTVHKTRMSAGGYGAMGPHPDREPA
jgi:hypothetical protein